MRPQDWRAFKSAENSWICEESLRIAEYLDSVGAWDVETGAYIGQTHRLCHWKDACDVKYERINGQIKPVYTK